MLKYLISLVLIITVQGALATPQAIYSFNTPQQQQQFNGLLTQLRCLVCQNEDLASSNAKLAIDLKQKVYARVLQGQSDATIKTYLVNRYGQFVLFKPAFNPVTYLLWLGPAILVLLGLIVLVKIVYANNRHQESTT